jgi:RHS repeat-associated protein
VSCQRLSYDEYGNLGAGSVATGQPYRFTGRRFDAETGLYYYRARYYASVLGRFLQADPVGYKEDFNLYSYVENDPLNRTDPTGQCDMDCPFMNPKLEAFRQESMEPFRESVRAVVASIPDRTSVSVAGKAGIGLIGANASVRADSQTLQDGTVGVAGRTEHGSVGASVRATVDLRLVGPDVQGKDNVRFEASAFVGMAGVTVQAGEKGVNVTARFGPQIGVSMKGEPWNNMKAPVTGGTGTSGRIDPAAIARDIAKALSEPSECTRAGCRW